MKLTHLILLLFVLGYAVKARQDGSVPKEETGNGEESTPAPEEPASESDEEAEPPAKGGIVGDMERFVKTEAKKLEAKKEQIEKKIENLK